MAEIDRERLDFVITAVEPQVIEILRRHKLDSLIKTNGRLTSLSATPASLRDRADRLGPQIRETEESSRHAAPTSYMEQQSTSLEFQSVNTMLVKRTAAFLAALREEIKSQQEKPFKNPVDINDSYRQSVIKKIENEIREQETVVPKGSSNPMDRADFGIRTLQQVVVGIQIQTSIRTSKQLEHIDRQLGNGQVQAQTSALFSQNETLRQSRAITQQQTTNEQAAKYHDSWDLKWELSTAAREIEIVWLNAVAPELAAERAAADFTDDQTVKDLVEANIEKFESHHFKAVEVTNAYITAAKSLENTGTFQQTPRTTNLGFDLN